MTFVAPLQTNKRWPPRTSLRNRKRIKPIFDQKRDYGQRFAGGDLGACLLLLLERRGAALSLLKLCLFKGLLGTFGTVSKVQATQSPAHRPIKLPIASTVYLSLSLSIHISLSLYIYIYIYIYIYQAHHMNPPRPQLHVWCRKLTKFPEPRKSNGI